MELTKLESEICLQNAAKQYIIDSGEFELQMKRYRRMPTLRVERWDSMRKRKFGDWLFEQGAVLVQKDKHCHIEFFDEQSMTLFLLKWMT